MSSEADRLARRALKDPDPAGVLRGHLAESARRRATSRDRSAPRKDRAAAEKRDAREARAAIRAAAMERDGGRCVVCGDPMEALLQLHHVCGRHREALDTCVIACHTCHALIHQGREFSLRRLAAYCAAAGMTAAALATSKRLARIEDSRASRGEP